MLYVPKIQKKLLSLPSITESGAEVSFKDNSCTVEKIMRIGQKNGKLYKLNTEEVNTAYYGSTIVEENSAKLWHSRYGHLG